MGSVLQGLETLTDVSETQLEACAGGPVLRAEGVYVTLNSKGIQKGAQVLLQALQQVNDPHIIPCLLARKFWVIRWLSPLGTGNGYRERT